MGGFVIIVLGFGMAFAFWHELRDRKRRKQAAHSSAITQAVAANEAEADLEDAVLKLLAIHVVEHERTLLTKRRQTIFTDDYGVEDRSRWNQELCYFIDRVCDPSILAFHKERCLLDETPYVLIGMEIDELLDAGGGSAKPAAYRANMAGLEFERLVAERLESAGADVRFTPVTGDQGADLIVSHNGETIVVQCKRSASTVGNKAVQEAHAGRTFHDAEHAWVVSDAPFSRAARQLASSLSVRLVDFDQVEVAL